MSGYALIFCRSCKQIIASIPSHEVPREITCPSCLETHKVYWQKKCDRRVAELKYRITAVHERSKLGMMMLSLDGIRERIDI